MMAATNRRGVLKLAGAAAGLGAIGLAGCAMHAVGTPDTAQVLVVGGGYGGATAAKYVRLLSQQRIGVVLVEPDATFVSCPMSNRVIAGSAGMADITRSYDALRSRHGVQIVRDRVASIDAQRRIATLASGASIRYDKLVLSPGVELMFDKIAGLGEANRQGRILQAWSAGPETLALRRQLEAMPDGGVFAISIPLAPYRCPPGPYERASLVAHYFKSFKPRSKVLVVDANQDLTSKGALFKSVWAESYPGLIEYLPQHRAESVDVATNTLKFEIQDDVRADVLNVLPPMRAGEIAVRTGLADANDRWCSVRFLNFESTQAKHIHVIGDSIQVAPAMPKSGHMANGQGKVVAAALVAELQGWEIDPAPMLTNTCYSFVDDRRVMHVASVHAYSAAHQTFETVPGSGGLSPAANERETPFAFDWARAILADTLA